MRRLPYSIMLVLLAVVLLVGIIAPVVRAQSRPIIKLEPVSGSPGDPIEISGEGFSKGVPVEIFWDESLIHTTETNTFGGFATAIVAPKATEGVYIITARDDRGIKTAARFEVVDIAIDKVKPDVGIADERDKLEMVPVEKLTPGDATAQWLMTVDPDSGSPGESVHVFGEGFTRSVSVNIYWDNELSFTGTTDADGQFAIDIVIPETEAGKHAIRARDGGGRELTALFEVVLPDSGTSEESEEGGGLSTALILLVLGLVALAALWMALKWIMK